MNPNIQNISAKSVQKIGIVDDCRKDWCQLIFDDTFFIFLLYGYI